MYMFRNQYIGCRIKAVCNKGLGCRQANQILGTLQRKGRCRIHKSVIVRSGRAAAEGELELGRCASGCKRSGFRPALDSSVAYFVNSQFVPGLPQNTVFSTANVVDYCFCRGVSGRNHHLECIFVNGIDVFLALGAGGQHRNCSYAQAYYSE